MKVAQTKSRNLRCIKWDHRRSARCCTRWYYSCGEESQFVIVNIVMGVGVVFQNENERTKLAFSKSVQWWLGFGDIRTSDVNALQCPKFKADRQTLKGGLTR